MATYKEIYGTNVEVLASDPSNPVEGQIWYNSTSQTLKGYALVAGSWATAGPLNTARSQSASAGTETAALCFGGSSTVTTGATESYNGTAWTTSPNSLNTARRYLGGCGATNTAALAFGGFTPPTNSNATETWNGTSWTTSPATLNTAKYAGGSAAKLGPSKSYVKPMGEEVEIDEDWQSVNRKDKTDGLSQKAVNAYRRENPGSKLQTAVTEKKPTGKRAKRRLSFCSRMKGMKSKLTSAETSRDPDSRINKALRRWNCN